MPPPWRIDWYTLYGAAVDAAWLSGVIVRHTDVLTRAAATIASAESATAQRDIVFVDATSPLPRGDLATRNDGDDVPLDAPFPLHLASAALRVYGVPRLRSRQVEAVSRLVLDESPSCRLMLVDLSLNYSRCTLISDA